MAGGNPITLSAAVESLELLSLSGREELGRPFEYELELANLESRTIAASDLLGTGLTVHLELPSGEPRHFNGVVTRFATAGMSGRFPRYLVSLRPWLWLLTRTTNCRVFQHQTVPQILKAVFRDHGFSDFEESLLGSYAERDYAVQYRESDFAFVSRLMEEEGIYYFFKHDANRHVLVLADSHSAHTVAPGYEVVPFLGVNDRRSAQVDRLHEWHVTSLLESGAYALNDYDFERPQAPLLVRAQKSERHPHDAFELYDYPGRFVDRGLGENYARIRLEERHAERVSVFAAGNPRGLGAGNLFTLADHPEEAQNREHLVLRAHYRLEAQGYESKSDAPSEEEVFRSELWVIDSSRPFRPRCSTPKPVLPGPQTARVVGPGGEEIWTDRYGRIKVRFHWNRSDPGDENSSCWVRVAQIWAGSHWGASFLPRIGQEVVVEFLEGDPDRPLVVGSVYNGDNAPPFDLPAHQTQNGLRSHSSPRGAVNNCNEIRLEDKKGSEQFFVQAERDLVATIKHDERREVGVNRGTKIGVDETLDVGGHRTTTIGKNHTLTIGASQSTSVGADDTLSVSGSRTKLVGGSETVSVEGTQTLVVVGARAIAAASETLTVGSRTKDVATSETISVGGARAETVSGNETIQIGGNRAQSVAKNETVAISGKRSETVDKDDLLRVGKRLVVEAGDEIVFKSGKASVTLKKNGDITLKGKNITLEGSGKIRVTADSQVVLKGSKVTQN